MTSLGLSASVKNITIGTLNAKTLNPPLAGVLNPLEADLSIGGNDILDAKNIKCSQLNFTTINGLPIAAGTLANPLLVALDGNGAGGPYSFENIGVGACATISASGAISCGSADATSGTFTTNTLTTTNNGSITGTTTATGLTTTNTNSIVKEVGSVVNGNRTITGAKTAKDITATSLTNNGDSTFKGLTTSGVLNCDSVAEGAGLGMNITGDITLTGNCLMGGNNPNKGLITAGSLQMPIVASLGTSAAPLDLTGIAGGTLNLGTGGKGVVYAYTTNPGSTYPIIFTIQTAVSDPLQKGNLIVESQLYQTDAAPPYPNFVSYQTQTTGPNTFLLNCFYDDPSSSTTTHRVSVIYIPDNV
jgi:hypothetical protein